MVGFGMAGWGGIRDAVLRADGVFARKAGRRVAFVPTDSIATAAAAVRS